MLTKIISGGQTGADIAAIDAAIDNSFPYGGTLPKGRKQEQGNIVPARYTDFDESVSSHYMVRTEKNVRDADGTVVFHRSSLTGGTRNTVQLTHQCSKPCCVINIDDYGAYDDIAKEIMQWVLKNNIKVLNVAGARASKDPHIYGFVKLSMDAVLNLNNNIPATLL